MKKNKQIKALFIDVVNQTISQIDMPQGLENIYKQLGYNRIELIPLGGKSFMYVDENARLKKRNELQGWFMFAGCLPVLNNAIAFYMEEDGNKLNMPIQPKMFKQFVDFQNLEALPEARMIKNKNVSIITHL